jgi:DNA polymerase-3 subunit epsilon
MASFQSPYRRHAIQRAKNNLAALPVFLDTETTGLDNLAEVVEICIVDLDGKLLFESLVKPLRQIPAEAVSIHGISNQLVSDAPRWIDVWPRVNAILKGKTVGIYNADFDLRMLRQTNRLIGWNKPGDFDQTFCIMKLYSDFIGTSRFISLDVAGRNLGISLPNKHRAQDDALLAREVFLRICQSD